MTTAATSLLGLALPVTGELAGSWGDTVNNSITSLLDSAVAGTTTLSTDGDVTLTTTTLAANQARQAILLCSGARTALRTITAPAQSKIYTIINATTGGFSVKLVGVGPTTGVTIVAGESAVCAWNGSDFIKVSNTGGSASFTNVTVSGTTTLSGLTASTALALNSSKEVVSVTNTGTGNNVLSASPTLTGTVGGASLTLSSLTSGRVTYAGTSGLLQDSANLTFDGTSLTLGGNPTLSGGTANGVLYLNGSKVATSGSALTFDGTNFATTGSGTLKNLLFSGGTLPAAGNPSIALRSSDNVVYHQSGSANNIVMLDSAQNTMQSIGATAQTWNISNSEAMRLTSTGLGVGTSSPGAKLDVNGSIYAGGAVALSINSAGSNYGQIGYNTGVGDVYWLGYGNSKTSAGTAVLNWNSSGNLGLGVTPSAWLGSRSKIEFSSAGTTAGFVGCFNGSSANNQMGLGSNCYLNASSSWIYNNSGAAGRYEILNNAHAWHIAASGTAGNAITFTQAMTLDADGDLGVGTTSPAFRLDVLASGATTWARIGNGGSNNGAGLILGGSSTTKNWVIANQYNVSGGLEFTQTTANGGSTISSTPSMLLDSSGNLGLGVTPSAWGSISRAMQFSGGISVFSNTSGLGGVGNNVYSNPGTGDYYIANGYATRYYQYNGTHVWDKAANNSSGAGASLTFTQAMTLDASGNLLVGITSAQMGGKIEAYSDIYNGAAGLAISTSNDTTGGIYAQFGNSSGTRIGSITRSGTSTVAYNTSSDYRLKDNPQPLIGSGAFIDALKPKTWNWKADGSKGVGFIAHEVQEVSPGSVVGQKDAVDEDGKPIMQAMEYGSAEFIANIIAELQSLRARVAALES